MKEIEIPEGYEAKIEGNKVIIESKESEDERIRKILYSFLDSALGKDLLQRKCGLNPDSVLTWFEKQKEQNGEDEESTDFTIYHPLKNGKGEYECIPYSFYGSLTSFSEDKDLIDFFRTCFYTEEECNEWIEQQKEQKPAWSEEDEKIRQSLLRDYEYAMQSSGTVWGEDFKKKHNWLKSLPERFSLQLKQKPPKTCTNYD